MNNLSKIIFLFLFSTSVFAQEDLCEKTAGVEKGRFTFDGPSTVCIGQEIKLRDNSGGTGVRYIFGYTPGTNINTTPSQTNTNYTFLAAGTYTVLQYGKKGGKDMYYCDVVRVLANTEPVFTTSACNNDLLEIIIGNDPANNFDYYQIDWGDATPVENIPTGTILPIRKQRRYSDYLSTRLIRVEGFYNTPTSCPRATAKQVNMDGGNDYPNIKKIELSEDGATAKITLTGALDNYSLYQRSASGSYVSGQPFMAVRPGTFTVNLVDPIQSCFKVYRSYGCNEGSGEVCTTKLDVKAQNKDNILTWMSHSSGVINQIYGVQTIITGVTTTINEEESGGATKIISSPGNPHIEQVDCSKEYCYQVVNKVQGTIDYGRHTYQSLSLSPKICINRASVTPDAITESVVTVKENNQVEITITDNSPWALQRKEYLFYKFENNTLEKIYDGTLIKQYSDASVDASLKSFCYKVAFLDECGSISAPSPPLCTIHLDQVMGGNLEWTNFSPFGNSSISKFEVESFDEQTNAPSIAASKNANELIYTPLLDNFEVEAKYRIKTIAANGSASFSNTYTIPITVKLFLPDAFTPNGDSVNDDLTIKGSTRRITNFEFQIFNRWGNPVFTSTDPTQTWDGKFQEINVPADTYSFKIIAKLDDGKELIKSGRFLLLR